MGSVPVLPDKDLEKKITDALEEIRLARVQHQAEISKKIRNKHIEEKLAKGGKWDSEELRAVVGIIDGYHIMAHYLFFTQDKIWKEMVRLYKKELKNYRLDPSDINSLENAWEEAEENNDRGFKEFYYAVVGAKFLEGHMKKLLEWMNGELIKEEIPSMNIPESEKKILIENTKKLKIAIENPDARDPMHAGLYLLWHPKQIYAAIKVIREKLKTDRVEMLIDFEHMATQGLDPVREMENIIEVCPDIGEITLAVHSNAPNPAHAHLPLELGDERIYRLLWFLRKTGLGKKRDVYIIYERGGGDDPFKQSVDVLRLCVKYLEENIPPEELPEEFYGFKKYTAGDIIRQLQIIRDHMFDPIKDLLEMPEEEWTFLSTSVVRKGRRPEQWKKAEFR